MAQHSKHAVLCTLPGIHDKIIPDRELTIRTTIMGKSLKPEFMSTAKYSISRWIRVGRQTLFVSEKRR